MLSVNQKSIILSLKQKKFRQKYQKFVIEGDKMVLELVNQLPEIIQTIVYQSGTDVAYLKNNDLFLNLVEGTSADFKQISALQTPQNLLAVCNMPIVNADRDRFNWAIFADGIQDPGNLGTILRISDWFGMQKIFLGPDTVDVYNPKVIQASMGAIWRVEATSIDLEALSDLFPEHVLVGADMHGTDVKKYQFPDKGILILGNEGNGINTGNHAHIKDFVRIPKHSNSQTESLNVAVSAGIICSYL